MMIGLNPISSTRSLHGKEVHFLVCPYNRAPTSPPHLSTVMIATGDGQLSSGKLYYDRHTLLNKTESLLLLL